ncbi:Cupin 2 conserved barrel domain protein [Thioalkalivibrio nitratireducens DSM 14787]|uniref:Cupin 2 conserved barrel domain protein n=1 Tax=Thioalkalivibrio nitratireducens (strain DSM 14787 / UNIQEM 213 / ALEN2) TaxID=1255043 RepID=L0DY58_THIND|nr:Cupin 2 conserved barrel domain protein [Thioalkalivibrio nitratireducens DSM 14787]
MALVLVLLLPLSTGLARDGGQTEVEVLAQTSRSWDGALLPAYPPGQPEVRILRIRIPAGARLPAHHHPVINAGVLLEGELTVVAEDGERLHLRAGDAIIELVEKWHYGRNEGNVPAEILVFYAGIEGRPVTVLETDHER